MRGGAEVCGWLGMTFCGGRGMFLVVVCFVVLFCMYVGVRWMKREGGWVCMHAWSFRAGFDDNDIGVTDVLLVYFILFFSVYGLRSVRERAVRDFDSWRLCITWNRIGSLMSGTEDGGLVWVYT